MKGPGRLAVMFALSSTLVASATLAASSPNIVRDGITFGGTEHLSGVYFTNFENSTFVLCDSKKVDCRDWAGSAKSYGLSCEPRACADLEARIKALNGSHDKWGLFAIDFMGRRSVGPEKSRWLGDPAKKVVVERVESLTLLKTQ